MRFSKSGLLIGLLIALIAGVFLLDFFSPSMSAALSEVNNEKLITPSDLDEARADANEKVLLRTRDLEALDGTDGSREDDVDGEDFVLEQGTDFLVKLVDEFEQPILGARVVSWLGVEVSEEGLTDKEGGVVFHPLKGEGGLVVLVKGFLPQFYPQSFEQSPVVVKVEAGGTLAGEVIFPEGWDQKGPYEIKIYPWPTLFPEGVPRGVLEGLEQREIHAGWAKMPLNSNHRFHLSGLQENWTGRLQLPHGSVIHSFKGPGKIDFPGAINLQSASDELRIEVARLPGFTGRVVSADGGIGIEGVEIFMAIYMVEHETNSTGHGAASRSNGSFHVPILISDSDEYKNLLNHPESIIPHRVYVALTGNEAWQGVEFDFDLRGRENPWDLGDLPMKKQTSFPIHVVDESGEPIAGAIAYTGILSKPTNAFGFGHALIGERVVEATVAAAGYESVSRSIYDAVDGVMEFELKRAVSLEVSWPLPPSGDMSAARIRIKSEGKIFATEDLPGGYRMRYALGSPLISGSHPGRPDGSRGTSTTWPLTSQQSSFSIWGLQPNMPMTVELIDKLGTALTTSQPMFFAPGDARKITLPPMTSPLEFRGRVRNLNGAPMVGADVSLMGARSGTGSVTDSQGEFGFANLAASTARLSIDMDGFQHFRMEKVEIFEGCQPLEITLKPADE